MSFYRMLSKLKLSTDYPFNAWILFCTSLFFFTWGVGRQEVIGFESRFYLFAQEMWLYGINWFPTTYQQAYPDYPVSSTLLIYFSAKLMGGLNKLSAVMPSAMASALTIVMTYLIGAKQSKKWGWYAVCFLLLTVTFVKTSRSITLDIYPTFITTACFYLSYSRDKLLIPWKGLALLLLIGFAFRGPIGLIMPAGVVCSYYFFSKKWYALLSFGLMALLLLLMSTALLLFLAYYQGGETFVWDVLRMEVLGRINDRAVPAYFYFTTGLKDHVLVLPVACSLMVGYFYFFMWKKQEDRQFDFIIKLCAWFFVILIGMSIPGDKKIRYILPLLPAASLLAAYIFIIETKVKYFLYLRYLLQYLLLFFPLLITISLLFLAYFKITLLAPMAISLSPLIVLLSSGQIIAILLYVYFPVWQTNIALIAAVSSLFFLNLTVLEPIELFYERAHDFVVQLEERRLQEKMALVFYKSRADGAAIKYLINMPVPSQPVFIDQEKGLQQFTKPAFFITTEKNFQGLSPSLSKKFQVITQDKLGHASMVIFRRVI